MLKKDHEVCWINTYPNPNIRRTYKCYRVYLYNYTASAESYLNKNFEIKWIQFRAKDYKILWKGGTQFVVIPDLYIRARGMYFYISGGHYVYDVNEHLQFYLGNLKNEE